MPPATPVSFRRIAMPALTCKLLSSSTTSSRGPTLTRSTTEQKASQSLPALQALVLNRGDRRPRGDRSEVSIRRACALTFASLWLGAPRSASRPSISRPGTRCRFPIPPSLSTRVSRRKRLCLPPKGLPACPRSNARHRPGLSVRGGPMRADGAANSRIDPPDSARPDLGADATVCPRGGGASPASVVAEMHMRSRITRFHF